MADFDTIKQEINVNIPDNNSQYITAKKVRDTLLDMIDDVDEAKQDALVSGTNIKTINGYTLLGSGDIVIEGGGDLSAYVSKEELSQMGYVSHAELNSASYVTSNYLSQASYVTNEYLSQASYVTSSDLSQASYVTASALSNMGYITSIPAEYITETELSNMSYATTSQLSSKQDALVSGTNIKTINNESLLGSGNIVIEGGGDLSAYVSKEELNQMGYVTSTALSNMSYVSHAELNSASYATTSDLNNAIAGIDIPTYTSDLTNDSGFITASDLSGYATETYVADYVATHSGPIDLSAYVTKTELSGMGYVTEQALSQASYITMSDVSAQGYITMSDVSACGYITASDLPDMSSYATLTYLETYYLDYTSFGDYTSEIQDTLVNANILVTDPETGDWTAQVMASETYVADYVATYAPSVDLSAYVTKTELSNAGYITSIPAEYITQSELSGMSYATTSQLPNMSDYVSKTELSNAGYITSIPSEYVTESELSAKGYVTNTSLSNMGYITSIPSEYVTQSELSGMSYATTSQLANKQDTLVSGTNIKTINNNSLLGSGNITISSSGNIISEVTQAEYDAMEQGGTLDQNTIYVITDAPATDLSYYAELTYVETYYVAKTDLANAGYITGSDLNNASYATKSYVNTYYVAKTDLANAGYITGSDLNNASYATKSYVNTYYVEKTSFIYNSSTNTLTISI